MPSVDLPEPGLARKAEPLAWGEREAYVIDGLHQAQRVVETDAQAVYPQDWLGQTFLRGGDWRISLLI